MSIYYKTYAKLLLGFVRKNPFKEAPPALTNTKWTAKIIEEVYDEMLAVLNSPIPLNVSIVKEPTDFFHLEETLLLWLVGFLRRRGITGCFKIFSLN